MALDFTDVKPSAKTTGHYRLMLADDDQDDCLLFREALEDLSVDAELEIANDGIQLMEYLLRSAKSLPEVVFLDLNMPRKTGFECLKEIRNEKTLDKLPVVILSTSYNPEVAEALYADGATFYIQKPTDFSILRSVIGKVLDMVEKNTLHRPANMKAFLLSL